MEADSIAKRLLETLVSFSQRVRKRIQNVKTAMNMIAAIATCMAQSRAAHNVANV